MTSSFFVKAQSNDGDSLFDIPAIHKVNINFSQTGFWDSLISNYASDKMMMASVTIDGKLVDSIGIQLKGNSSYNSYPGVKKSMKIDFNQYKNQKYDGLKTINLNNNFKDPTMLREKIMLDFCKKNNIPAPRCTYANVYLNNKLWGLYTIVEQVNKTFLSDRFGDNDGNLFKGDPRGTLQWQGSTASSYYPNYELKTNKTINDWNDLVHLIDKINNSTSSTFYDSLESVLDTRTFIDVWASNILFANLDSYQGSGHNYYIYKDTSDHKWKFITWDVNEVFGNFQMGMPYPGIETMSAFYIPSPSTSRPLMYNMLQNSTYKNQYVQKLCDFLSTDFTTGNLNAIIDSIANSIRTDVYADPNKMYSSSQFETNISSAINSGPFTIPGLKSFVSNRRTALVKELASYGCTVGFSEEKKSELRPYIFPNPSNGNIVINTGQAKVSTVEFYNVTGVKICDLKISNQPTEQELILPSGIYYYRILDGQNVLSSDKLLVK